MAQWRLNTQQVCTNEPTGFTRSFDDHLCSLLDLPLYPRIRDRDEDQHHLVQGEWPSATGFDQGRGGRARVSSVGMQCASADMCSPVPSSAGLFS